MAARQTGYARAYRAARGWAGLTRRELADQLGVGVETIKRRERGTHGPRPGECELVASICDVPANFMYVGWDAFDEDAANALRVAAERGAQRSDWPHDEQQPGQPGRQSEEEG